MKRETSIFLDAVRFSAAMAVFFFHINTEALGSRFPALWRSDLVGSAAVLVFFVLSGYVIAYATDRPGTTVGDYALARVARIVPVAVSALLLTGTLDAFGRLADPAIYQGFPLEFQALLVSLGFANEVWGLHATFGTSVPYWSLGYEVPFYLLFGILVFARGYVRAVGFVAVCLMLGPRIISLFPLWLMGAAGYFLGRRPIPRLLAWVTMFGALTGMVALSHWSGADGIFAPHPGIFYYDLHQIAQSYVFGFLFLVLVVSFAAVAPAFVWLRRIERPVRWLAGGTFSIYLFHFSVARFLAAQHLFPPGSWANCIMMLATPVPVCFLLAELTERRRNFWRTSLQAWMCDARLTAKLGLRPNRPPVRTPAQ